MNRNRNYPILLASQFISAFGDNALLGVIIGQLTYLQQRGQITPDTLRSQNSLYTLMIFIPPIFLSSICGYLNDRYPKTTWLARGNLVKLIGTLCCLSSIWLGFWLQGLGYFIVGIGVSIYGPAKYGILPEILPRERLVKANGMVELLTLVAILTGGIAGAKLSDVFRDQVLNSYLILLAMYGFSWALNFSMSPTPANVQVKFGPSTGEFFRHAAALFTHPRLSRTLIGTALFWVCGAMLKINFQPWGLEVLHFTTNTQIAILGVWLSVGLMLGSLLAGAWFPIGQLKWTRLFIGLLAVPVGILSLVKVSPLLQGPVLHLGEIQVVVPVTVLLMLAGVIAGLFLIPLNASLQDESDHTKLGKTIAVQNLNDNLGMLLAGGLCFAAAQFHLSSSNLFIVVASVLAAAALFFRMPPR
jgi:MFS transporter, LPLT family, lysophospholipid transporter